MKMIHHNVKNAYLHGAQQMKDLCADLVQKCSDETQTTANKCRHDKDKTLLEIEAKATADLANVLRELPLPDFMVWMETHG